MNRRVPRSLVAAVVLLLSATPRAQTVRKPPPVFRSGTELVLVNVVVRDRSGGIVRGLRQEDFALSEDDKATWERLGVLHNELSAIVHAQELGQFTLNGLPEETEL